MDQLPPSATIEAAIAIYGIPDSNHNVLTREAAEQFAEQLRDKTTTSGSTVYRITSTRLEGDEQRGHVIAIFTLDEGATQQEEAK